MFKLNQKVRILIYYGNESVEGDGLIIKVHPRIESYGMTTETYDVKINDNLIEEYVTPDRMFKYD